MFLQGVKKLIALLAVAIFCISCRVVSYSETHVIKIDHYETQAENEKLVEEIFNYGPEYIMSNIPSFTEEMNGGVSIGYSLPTTAEKVPTFRYTLKLNVASVAKNKEQLKSNFEEFIPKLVQTHTSKKQVYKRLAPRAEKWLLSVFNEPLVGVYSNTSSKFKESATEEKFIALANQYKSALGNPLETEFLSGYYVDDDKKQGEVLLIMFAQKFAEDRKTKSQVIFTREGKGWGISGYKIYSQ